MSYFVGLDVSLRSVALCVVDSNGDIVLERALDCEVEAIDGYLREFDKPIKKLGFEAGVMSQMLFHGLQALGYDVVCMEAVLRKCVDLENEIRGLFKTFGIRLPSTLAYHRFEDTVRPIIEADESLAFALTPMLEARGALYVHYREMDKRVKRVAAQDPVCNLLMTTPGVGAMTALHFKAAVDDPERFNSSRTVAARFGLTPRCFQSGEMDNPGRISRVGDTEMRATLYTAANSLLTRTKQMSPLKSWGLRLIRRRGRKRGTVAVARKLAVILHRMWIDGRPYRWSDVEVAK